MDIFDEYSIFTGKKHLRVARSIAEEKSVVLLRLELAIPRNHLWRMVKHILHIVVHYLWKKMFSKTM